MHDADRYKTLAKLAGLQVEEKQLGVTQLGRVDTKHDVGIVRKPAHDIQIDRDLFTMLLDYSLGSCQGGNARYLVVLGPLGGKTIRRKAAVDPRFSEKLLTIRYSMSRRRP